MAKLGNEAKLVLKLLVERLDKAVETNQASKGVSDDYARGFAACAEWTKVEFKNVQLEVEDK